MLFRVEIERSRVIQESKEQDKMVAATKEMSVRSCPEKGRTAGMVFLRTGHYIETWMIKA